MAAYKKHDARTHLSRSRQTGHRDSRLSAKLHYWLGGDPNGKPVLLWHGFLGTAHSWYKVMPLLAQAGYLVLAPDMRGYGDSDKPAGTAGYDAHALAADFRALVQQIGFGQTRKLFLIGHDMGAPPALLWAADHADEVAALIYMEVPTMLEDILSRLIVYTPEAMRKGSMWWWILPLAPGVPERLIVGREREFLTWFYQEATADPSSISEASIEETLRTFSGTEGVLGALGLYRAAFKTVEQTTPLQTHKVTTPVLALGGEKALGSKVAEMLKAVASNVTGMTIRECGHFIPEEQPQELVRLFHEFADEVMPFLSRRAVLSFAALLTSPASRLLAGFPENMQEQSPNSTRRHDMFESKPPYPPLPADDLQRNLTFSQPDTDQTLPHIGLVGDTYTITVSGDDTSGRFCIIDMHVPPGGGPPPHRHDFEETFVLLDGEVELTFRGKKSTAKAGDTVNIPSNAPHQFHNASSKPARLLCICSPAGQENFFQQVGVPVATRTTAPPKPSKEEMQKTEEKSKALAPKYRTEMLQKA